MKQLLTIAVSASMILALAGMAQADDGMPSQATLQAMGLSGMQVMSDREAMDVRGLGFYSSRKHSKSVAIAFGISFAGVHGKKGAKAGSLDGFLAVGKHKAAGAHGSIAGIVHFKKKGRHGDRHPNGNHNGGNHNGGGHHGGGHKVKATVVFAGGFAISHAH